MTYKPTLTVEDIAEILHMTTNTLQRKSWRKKTGCPLRKIGKRLIAKWDEFWKWFNNWR